jgi:hypothetical protein
METTIGCSSASHSFIDGGTVIFCTKCGNSKLKLVPEPVKRRGMRRVKLFVKTGYNDGSGDPKQAQVTAEAS